MADHDVKTEVSEGVYVIDVEGGSLDWPRAKSYAFTTVSMLSPVLPLSRYTQATQAAIASSGAPPDFEAFELHVHEEYGGLHRDQMQRIQDFRREKDNTPRTMYTRLARFARESECVFVKNQLVKVFLSKIDKRLLDLWRYPRSSWNLVIVRHSQRHSP